MARQTVGSYRVWDRALHAHAAHALALREGRTMTRCCPCTLQTQQRKNTIRRRCLALSGRHIAATATLTAADDFVFVLDETGVLVEAPRRNTRHRLCVLHAFVFLVRIQPARRPSKQANETHACPPTRTRARASKRKQRQRLAPRAALAPVARPLSTLHLSRNMNADEKVCMCVCVW